MTTIVDGTAGVTTPGTGSVTLTGSSSGTIQIVAPATAGTNTLTMPAATDTVAVQSQAVRQVVSTFTGTMATGSGASIPFDNTIPQNTEGDQFMSLSITPKSATSRLLIDVTWIGATGTVSQTITAALFQDTTANALAAACCNNATGSGVNTLRFLYSMTSGTTSSTTFKVRAGADGGGVITFNGVASTARMGGVFVSNITITEVGG